MSDLLTTVDLDGRTPPVLLPAEPLSPGWFAARQQGVTATDIAKICGLYKYGSAWEVYQDKIGDPLPDEAGEAAEIGNLLEPVIAEMWARKKNRLALPAGLFANSDRPWMLATPDRLVTVFEPADEGFAAEVIDGPLEIKTALGWSALDWADEGQVPDAHMCQVQWQMGVLGCDRAWIAALAGPRLVSYEVQRDQGYIDDLIAVAEQFREQVANRQPPAPDGSDRLADLLRHRWEPDPDKTVVLSPSEFEPLHAAYDQACADEKDAKARKTAAQNAIRLLMADAEAAVIDDRIVATWKAGERAGYTVAPTTTRTLLIKKAKS